MNEQKDYLGYENARNHKAKSLFTAILHEAFGNGSEVVIGHHLTFDGDDPNEIPSADTMIFDHDIMGRVFGSQYKTVMMILAVEPCETRDARLAELYASRSQPTTVAEAAAGPHIHAAV